MAQSTAQYLTKSSTNNNIDPIPMKWKTSTSDFIPSICEAMDSNNDISDLDNDGIEENQPTTNTSEHRIEERSFHPLEVMIFYGSKSSQGTKHTH